MPRQNSTAFDRYVSNRMEDPEFEAEYKTERTIIDGIDTLINSLDDIRSRSNISKAELARRIGSRPEVLRRLLTERSPNPTMKTVLQVMSKLGVRLEMVPDKKWHEDSEEHEATATA